MKTLVIYKSIHHQNTKKIAEVIAKELGADLTELEEAKNYKLEDYDLIGFGSGIYMWRHHRSLLKFVDSLSKIEKKAFIFSTSGAGFKDMIKNHKILKEKLEKRGFQIIGEFNCPGWDTFGPFKLIGGFNKGRPNEEDFAKGHEFAKSLKIKE